MKMNKYQKLFIALMLLSKATFCSALETMKTNIVFLDKDGLGYPCDSHEEVCDSNGNRVYFNGIGVCKLKPGVVAGSLEWEEIHQLVNVELEKYGLLKQQFYAKQLNIQNEVCEHKRDLTETERKFLQEFGSISGELLRQHESVVQDLCEKQNTVFKKFRAIAIRIAKEMGADAIVNYQHNDQLNPIVINPKCDITKKVLEELNAEYRALRTQS